MYKDQLSLTNPTRCTAVWRTCNKFATNAKFTTLRIDTYQFSATSAAFNIPNLHLAPPWGVTPFEFCHDFLASEN